MTDEALSLMLLVWGYISFLLAYFMFKIFRKEKEKAGQLNEETRE